MALIPMLHALLLHLLFCCSSDTIVAEDTRSRFVLNYLSALTEVKRGDTDFLTEGPLGALL